LNPQSKEILNTTMAIVSSSYPVSASLRNTLLAVQSVLVLICVLVAWAYVDHNAALAAGYGGAIAWVNAFLLARSIRRAGELVKTDPKLGTYALYFGAIQRFVLVIAGLGIGLAVLHLSPFPLLLAFGIAQLAYIIVAGMQAKL
jgi:F0F1-type ATP synthase assembly protein I